MANLKESSTIGGAEIAKEDLSNVSSTLPASVVAALKGPNGANGTNGSNVTYAFSGSALYITTP